MASGIRGYPSLNAAAPTYGPRDRIRKVTVMTDLSNNGDLPLETSLDRGPASGHAVMAVGVLAAEAERMRIRMAREALGAS